MMKKVFAMILLLAMVFCGAAHAAEIEPIDAAEEIYSFPEERWISLEDYSAKVFYDLPYCGEDSTETEVLHLVLPEEGEGPFPVIVSVHGGGWGANNSTKENQVTFTQAAGLAGLKRGYAVACVDYTLKKKNTPVVMPLAIQEVRAAIRYLRSVADEYNLDVDHFALIGESAGGQIADMAALTSGEEFYDNPAFGNMDYSADVQAVIAQYSAPIMGMNAMTARLYNVEESALTQEMADAITALNHIDANDPPFYIEAGSADTTIPYTDSVALYEALVSAGVENCEVHIYEGMEHSTAWFQSEPVTEGFLNWLDARLGR
ncbi:MAG: alpha/beta hydrolase [Oscillospiraceae bacterium]|nr:alpha/beta hydrolase [Oscillospiraceae bacterium]